jgi:hypothetical protein
MTPRSPHLLRRVDPATTSHASTTSAGPPPAAVAGLGEGAGSVNLVATVALLAQQVALLQEMNRQVLSQLQVSQLHSQPPPQVPTPSAHKPPAHVGTASTAAAAASTPGASVQPEPAVEVTTGTVHAVLVPPLPPPQASTTATGWL